MVEKITSLFMAVIIALGIYSNMKLREENRNNLEKQKKELQQKCEKEKFEEKIKNIFRGDLNGDYKVNNSSSDINFSVK